MLPLAWRKRLRPSSPRRRFADLTFVAMSAFCVQAGMSAYSAVFNNFIVNDLHINAQQLGAIESFREIPGFLTVVLAAVTVRFRVSRLAAAALTVMGIGMASIAGAHSFWYLVLSGMVWSIGFHMYNPLNNGLVLAAAAPSRQGRALGWIGSVGSIGALVGMGLVFLMVPPLGLRYSFVPAGLMILAGGAALLFLRDREAEQRVRLVFRRRYWIYYALTLLDGSRRQIFSTFAVFLLIKVYGLGVYPITALLVLNSIVSTIVTPYVGRLIDRHGERPMLALNYACLSVLFAGYALVHNLPVLGVLYCVDNALFAFGLGISSYLGRMAPRPDVTPTLAMGSTFNHVAAVGVPLVGGLLWNTAGYQVTFLAGAATCLLSVLIALAIRAAPPAPPAL
jgi:predicted MFS family arabinose efflux permease